MVDWVRLLLFVPLVFAARVRRIERRTIGRLQDAGATIPERSILLETGGPVTRWVHGRLRRAGALQGGAEARYYLDADAYAAFRRRRRRRGALIAVAVVMLGIALFYLTGEIS